MKPINKKRIENLAQAFHLKDGKPIFAMVIYGENFDTSTLDLDIETVLFLPDNGRDPDLQIPKESYKVFFD